MTILLADVRLLLPSILVFLAPLAVYCWVLAALNRRPRPTMVSGIWDCAGMLLASAGILLVVGPVLLYTLYYRDMTTLPLVAANDAAVEHAHRQHWLYWAIYFVAVLGGVMGLLWWRRRQTVIYNVDPERFAHLLARTLERLNFSVNDGSGRLTINRKTSASANNAAAELTVAVFPALCNVTLHWRGDRGLRATIESDLALGLDEARTLDNPAAHWLLGVTGILFGVIFLTGMVWVLINYFPPRRW